MIELWQGLLALLQGGRLVKHHLVEAREYLVRSWHVPAAQGPLRQGARTVGPRIPAGGQEREEASAVLEAYEPRFSPAVVSEPETVMIGGYQEEMERLDRELVLKALGQCRGSIREALRLFEEAEPDRHTHILDLWRGLLALAENQGLTDHKLLEARDFAMAAFARKPARAPEPTPSSSVPEGRRLRVAAADPVGELAPGDYKKAIERRDRQLIAAALDQCQGRLRETCRLLGISEPTLRDKLKRYGLKG